MNVKAGQMAYIAKSPDYPQHVGKIVEVRAYNGRDHDGDDIWACVSREPLLASKYGPIPSLDRDVASRNVDIPDAWLRPISGVPVHDEQHHEVKEPA